MKFIVFTSEYPPMRTGVAAYNHVVVEGLLGHGHDVTVLTFRPPGVRSRQTLAREIRLPIGTQKWLELARIVIGLTAYRFLARRFDSALLTSDLAQRIAGDSRLGGSTRFVCVVHGSEVTKRFPRRALTAQAAWRLRLSTLRRASGLIAVSGYTRDLLISAGLGQAKIDVVYNGIPDAWFDSEADVDEVARLKRWHGIGPNEIVVLTLARVVERKGHDRVLRALHSLQERHAAIRYVIAGTGDQLEAVRKLADELCLGDRVIFTGEVPEEKKKSYYDLCDVFVMPSLHDGRRVEGLGISLIEAAARRKPSIGGNHGGVPEVIDDTKTGYLVNPDDIESLAERLSTLAADAQLRRQIGEAAYMKASSQFRVAAMISSIERLLRAAASVSGEVMKSQLSGSHRD